MFQDLGLFSRASFFKTVWALHRHGNNSPGSLIDIKMHTATEAFGVLLKTLCLGEFPCGDGNWRKQTTVKTVPLNYGKKVMKIFDKTEPQFSTTLNEYDASKMHIETLQEFVTAKHSPWTFDYSWSDEAKSLRELAVQSPELVNEEFIYSHFTTLRLTDKDIEDVDENLLKFSKLQYLTLSANLIKNVNSKNLPRNLVSLELNSNQVSELFSLCVDPPALVHLGLGNNCLTYVDDYLSGDHWPALLSLDLSFNNLTDLTETLRKLKSLPSLRNLILMGNPLMLTPGYRGFVIDNLKKIDVLDDLRIEADERHRYTSMSMLNEQELSKCKVIFEVGHIRNVPKPLELVHSEEQPEYPIITRNYYVEFHYVDEAGFDSNVFDMNLDAGFDFGALGPIHAVLDAASERDNMFTPRSAVSGFEAASSRPKSNATEADGAPDFFNPPQQVTAKKASNILRTEKGVWSPDIELNWSQATIRDDLLRVRDFLQKPMKIDVVEETILSYPNDDASEKASSAKKKKDPDPKKDDKKAKGKKKDLDQNMRHEPPEINILVSFEAQLDQFLSGQNQFKAVITKNGVQSRLPSGISENNNKKEKGRAKSAEKKTLKVDQKSKEAAQTQDNRKKSGKKDGKKKEQIEVELDPNLPPPPLQVDVGITLIQWSSTSQSKQDQM